MHRIKILKHHYLLFKLLAVSFILFCDENPVNRDTASGSLAMTIFEPGGNTVATGVSIKIFNISSPENKPVASYTTNDKGSFTIENISAGCYSLWAQKDTFVLFQDSIVISPLFSTLHNDTLEFPSSLKGFVKIECGHSPGTVAIHIKGTDITETVNDDGSFLLNGMSRGTYECSVTSTLKGYLPLTRSLTITGKKIDTLSDTLHLMYLGIPFVENVQIIEDTLNNCIHISWKKTSYSNVLDYAVYRTVCNDTKNSTPLCLTSDTFYIDTICSIDSTRLSLSGCKKIYMNQTDTSLKCFRYRIAIRNRNQEIGPALGYEYNFAPRGRIITYFSYDWYVLDRWCGVNPCKSPSVHDTISLSVKVQNFNRPLCTLLVYNPSYKYTFSSTNTDTMSRNNIEFTTYFTFDSIGSSPVLVTAIDNSGNNSTDTLFINVTEDSPSITQYKDSGVFCGTDIHLYGNAKDLYGFIAKWEWKIGEADWTTASSPETTFTAPATERVLICQLAATDDDGNRTVSSINVFVSNKVTTIAAEGNQTFFTKTDGELWTCGSNEFEQFGENVPNGNIFTAVNIKEKFQSVATGSSFVMILKNDGCLFGCGRNNFGQLGAGPTALKYPFPICIKCDVKNIDAGGSHSLILATGGDLYACGNNNAGQIGDSSMQVHYLPILIKSNVKAIAAGEEHSLVLVNDGTLWTCGKNNYGQIGDSSMFNQSSLVQVMTGVEAIAAGSNHSLILKSDGSLWACGQNNFEQLGVDITESWSLPVLVTPGVKKIAAGKNHSIILKTDGTVWTFGNNSIGQLGNNTNNISKVPVQIMKDVVDIASGYNHNLMMKTDGSLWGCGENTQGQLGNLMFKYYPKPVRIIPFHDNTDRRGLP